MGLGLGMNLHRPPMNLLFRGQKQLGGTPCRPPVHLPPGPVLVVFGLGVASVTHCPERVLRVPGGQGLPPPSPGPVAFGRTHLPFS